MKYFVKLPLTVPALVCATLLHGFIPNAVAANKTWSGAGGDANWATAGNWGGAAPVNADYLIFASTTKPINTNTISGLSVGGLTFNNDGFGLYGNALTLNPTGNAAVTNTAGTNTLALPLVLPLAGKVWSVAPNSELRVTGALTNQAATGISVGWLFLTNGGTVRLMNLAQSTRGMDLFSGSLIVDGGYVDHFNDGVRFKVPAGQTVTTRIVNNGTWRIGGGGNFRMGDTGSGAGSLSQMILDSGTLELYGPLVTLFVSDRAAGPTIFTQNGGLVWGSGGSGTSVTFGNAASPNGTYNLNGGTLWIGQIKQVNSGANVFNFNGGTLRPVASTTTFMQGLNTANVQPGGAVIDTTNLNITIAQNLLAAGAGGLTKLGSGTLTLSGSSSHAGGTVVSNGTMLVTGALTGGGGANVVAGALGGTGSINGAVTVQPGAQLAPGVTVGTLTLVGGLTLNGNVSLDVNKSLSPSNDLVQVSGALACNGAGTVFIANNGPAYAAGDIFKCFSQPVPNGGSLTLSPSIPAIGLLWTNRLAIDGTIGVVALPTGPTLADLAGLSLSSGTLAPAFEASVLGYASSLIYSNRTLTLTPTSAEAGATIRVIANGATNLVASGTASSPIALKVGTNVVQIAVTAPDNSLTKDYFVSITRIPPNVLLVLADDQGFSDWGCYGSEIPTPTLNKLAANGLRFRQFYNAARCSPTRCAILTGLYTQQAAVDPAQALPNLRNDNNVTIAEVLRANGYRTYMAGKWHLGTATGYRPWERGFQHYWGFPNGHSADNWKTNEYLLFSTNNEVAARLYPTGGFYQTDAIGDYSVDFLNHHFTKQDQQPFFLYLTFGAAHFPLQAPKALVNSNNPVYVPGWDVVRNARYTNMLAQGFLDAKYLLSARGGTAPHSSEPIEEIPAWNTLTTDRQADLARRMAVYAAMVQNMDDNIGRVVERLRQAGQLENTLIICLSDNGGNHEGGRFGQTGGVNNATPLTGTALDNMGQNGQPIIYLGGGWANVNNTPLRLFKHSTHGGGVRTPMIVHWPQGLSRTNEWTDQPGHLMDIMATIAEVTGSSYPTQFNGHAVLPIEGQSLQATFNTPTNVARTIGFEHESNRGLIQGSWKFVTKNFTLFDGSSPANELELYDLSTDPVELTNLAYAQPQRVAQMATNWNIWAAHVGVPAARFLTYFTNTPPAVPVIPAPSAADLFLDNFERANQTDIDASATGMSGSRLAAMGANATYYEGYEGSGLASSIQTLSSNLQMAVGFGMAENGLRHNFIGQDIIDAGGFSVEMNVLDINNTDFSDAANRFAGFGVGLTQAEAAGGGDITTGSGAFRGTPTGNVGVADFFVELDLNSNIKVWRNGALLDTVAVGANVGTLTASFELGGFATSDPVTVKVFFNGQLVDINTADPNSVSRNFNWDANNSNYIGLSARAANYVQMDNLAIRKLPLTTGLATDYALRHGLSGAATATTADPDGDGVNNFAEWAFGGDPAAPDAYLASLKGSLVVPSNNFRFEFQRLKNYAAMDLQFRYYVSEDLTAWTKTTPTPVYASDNEDRPGYEVVTMQLPPSVMVDKNHLFLRVWVNPVGQ